MLYLLDHGVPGSWIEQMDDDTLIGWVWNTQLLDGFEWSNALGHPVEKTK